MLRFSNELFTALLLLVSLTAFAQSADDLSVPKQHDGKWGYCRLDGQWLIPPVYDDAFLFCYSHGEDAYTLRLRNMTYEGENITFLQPLALVMKNGLYGLLNTKGEEVLPCVSQEPFVFMALGGNFIGVRKAPLKDMEDEYTDDFDMAIMHVNGTLLLPFVCNYVYHGQPWYDMQEGWLAMEKDIPAFPDFIPDLKWLRVRQQNREGYINEVGVFTIPPDYTYLSRFGKGTAVACSYDSENGKRECWFIDTLNHQIDTLAGEPYGDFNDGWLQVFSTGSNRRMLMVNHLGTYMTPVTKSVMGYRKGLAISLPDKTDNNYYVHDTSGQVIFQFQRFDDFYAYRQRVLMRDAEGYWWHFAKGRLTPTNRKAEKVGHPMEMGDRYFFSVRHQGKWGLWDESGQELHPFVWDTPPQWLERWEDEVPESTPLIVEQAGKKGLVSLKMEVLIPLEYDQIHKSDSLIWVRRDGKKGLFSEDYSLLMPPVYDDLKFCSLTDHPKAGYLIKEKGKYGYLDTAGQIFIPPVFSKPLYGTPYFAEGFFVVQEGNESIILNRNGITKRDTTAKYEFHYKLWFKNRKCILFKVYPEEQPDQYYVSDSSFNPLTPIGYRICQYAEDCEMLVIQAPDGTQGAVRYLTRDTIVPFKAHLVRYQENGEYFLITSQDTLHEVFFWKEGRRLVLENRETRASDPAKAVSITVTAGPCRGNPCRRIGGFHEGLADYCELGYFGFLDTSLAVVIPAQYSKLQSFSEGLAAVCKGNKWGFIDHKGQEKIPFEYEDALSFFCGYVAVKKASGWGLIDSSGRAVSEFKYRTALITSSLYWMMFYHEEGLDIWGCDGTLLLENISNFYPARPGKRHHYWTKEGFYAEYPMSDDGAYANLPYANETKPLTEALWAANLNGLWGVFDQDNACVVRPGYDEIEYLENAKLFMVRRHERYGLVSLNGQVLLPTNFDEIIAVEGSFLEVWKDGKKAYFAVGYGLFD